MKTRRIANIPTLNPSKVLRTLLQRLYENLNRYRDGMVISHYTCTEMVARSVKGKSPAETTLRLGQKEGRRFISQLSSVSLISIYITHLLVHQMRPFSVLQFYRRFVLNLNHFPKIYFSDFQ